MRACIGVIGPEDSIERILEMGADFKDIEFIAYPYMHVQEVEKIIADNKNQVDQWYFSGQSPYYYAYQNGWIRSDEAAYAQLHGSGFLGALLEGIFSKGEIIHKASIDTLAIEDLKRSQSFYHLNNIHFETFPYEGYLPAEKLIDFHIEQFEKNKVEAAFTCILSVYNEIRRRGYPVYRVIPSDVSIRMIIELLEERIYTAKYKQSQIALLGIEAILTHDAIRNLPYTYRLKRKELHLHDLLLSVAEDVQGSLRPLGDGLFFIYSTFGEIEHYLKVGKLRKLMHLSKNQTGIEIRLGVGYGASMLEAEKHVLQAFEHARQADFPQLVVMNEEKELIILDADESATTYEANNFGANWHELFDGASITPTMAVKILSFSQHYNKPTFTSQDVATWMKSTERNGRRIVTELERLGLIAIVNEQQSGSRGRPRKVYAFKNIQQ